MSAKVCTVCAQVGQFRWQTTCLANGHHAKTEGRAICPGCENLISPQERLTGRCAKEVA